MENLLSEVKKYYSFSGDTQIGETLQLKGGREVYTFVSGTRKYVLKIADTGKDEKGIERDTFIFSFLPVNGFENIPKLILTKDGKRYINLDGRFAYVLEYVQGTKPENTPKVWSKLGHLMAKLHKIENYPYKTPFTFENEKVKLFEIANILPFKDEYLALVATIPNLDEFPQALIHSDVGPHNSVQKSNGDIIFIDWDDSSVGNRILDLGFPLICQFVTEECTFMETEARAFYKAYAEENTITQQEKDSLFEAALFFALLYFPYGNLQTNWKRTQFAINNRPLIESVIG